MRDNKRTLIVVGTYSIGKERVFMGNAHDAAEPADAVRPNPSRATLPRCVRDAAIAEALGVPVYVEKHKRQTLECLNEPQLASRLTDDPTATNLHVMGMGAVSVKVGEAAVLSLRMPLH